jgi:hypothetical protein
MMNSRRMRWPRHVAPIVGRGILYRILMGKPEGRRPLRTLKCSLVNSIKMDLRGLGWDGVDWNNLARGRDRWKAPVNTVMNLMFSSNVGKLLSSFTSGGSSRSSQLHEIS